MGFFSTSFGPDGPSQTIFTVADNWWWFLALGIPFTIAVVLLVFVSALWSRKQVDIRRSSDMADMEKILSYEMGPGNGIEREISHVAP